jgi:hypothetical protein
VTFGRAVGSSQFSSLSQSELLLVIKMSEAFLVVAGVTLRVSRGSATVTGSDLKLELSLGDVTIVPSSIFFPSPAAALGVTRIHPRAFHSTRTTSMLVSRHVQIPCSECFSQCESLSSISFETDSELTHIKSNALSFCSSLQSITIPRHLHL